MLSLKTVNNIAFITIENQSRLKVVLSSLGASVFAIYFNDELMTLSLKDKIDFSNPDLYHGKTIGPVCGRIAYGKIDEYRYETNEENVARHGGKKAYRHSYSIIVLKRKPIPCPLFFRFKALSLNM